MKDASSNFLIVLASLLLGFIFFLFVPRVFRGELASSEKWDLAVLAIFEAILLPIALHIPLVLRFFEIEIPLISFDVVLQFFLTISVYTVLQYVLARRFSRAQGMAGSV